MSADAHEPNKITDKTVTRRDFLKVAGLAGAAFGVAGGASGVLAACGSSSSGGSSASPGGTGRTIKIGFVSPLTGPLARVR